MPGQNAHYRIRRPDHSALSSFRGERAMNSRQPIVVQKYGGSSLASVEQVRHVAGVVAGTVASGHAVVVVVSARGDTTDELLRLAEIVSPVRPARELDQLRAGGQHGSGLIARIVTTRIRHLLDEGRVVVVSGFQAVDEHGDVVTLGRGGSDTTAVAVAAELGAGRCEVYTDVDGIYTADPRIVPGSRRLPTVVSAVMTEMAFGGAKVMHSRAVELASLSGVDIEVRSSATAEPGTVVLSA